MTGRRPTDGSQPPLARETAANGHRRRVSGSIGLESCAGLFLKPLIANLDKLLAVKARYVEAVERRAIVRLEISKARRALRRLEAGSGDHPLVAHFASEWATWISLRSFLVLASAEAHLRAHERARGRSGEPCLCRPK